MLETSCYAALVIFFSTLSTGVSIFPIKATPLFLHGPGGPTDRCVDTYANALDKIRLGLGTHIRQHPRRTVMTSTRKIIFAAGPGTTGTSSLAAALIQLGLTTAHATDLQPNDYQTWWNEIVYRSSLPFKWHCFQSLREFDYTSLPDRIDAVTDTPVDFSFLDLFMSFPNAIWLLNTRPSKEWAKARASCNICKVHPGLVPPCEMTTDEFLHTDIARMFESYTDFVKCMVPRNRLFEFDVFSNGTKGLMHKLGIFLGVQGPPPSSAEFPYIEVEQLKYLQEPSFVRLPASQ